MGNVPVRDTGILGLLPPPSSPSSPPDCPCPNCPRTQFVQHLQGYSLDPAPEIFGLHDNADITCQQNQTYELLGTVLSLQPRVGGGGSSGGGSSQEATVAALATDILSKARPRRRVAPNDLRLTGGFELRAA